MSIEQHYRPEAWQHYHESSEAAGVPLAHVPVWLWILVIFAGFLLMTSVGYLVWRLPRFESVIVDCKSSAWLGPREPIGFWNAETLVARPLSTLQDKAVPVSTMIEDVRAACATRRAPSVTVRVLHDAPRDAGV